MVTFSKIAIVVLFAAIGFGCAKEFGALDEQTELSYAEYVDYADEESREIAMQEFFKAGREKLESLTNVFRVPGDRVKTSLPRQMAIQNDNQIALPDLGLVLRRVAIVSSKNETSAIYFSEVEITNRMYAVFLNETGQYRDDTDVEKAAAGRFTTFRYKVESGFGSASSSSTGSPSIQVKDVTSLWRNRTFPEQRGDHPVSCVTMQDAAEFCKWLQARFSLNGLVRLPTEEEWLFAAYGKDRQYPWGNEPKSWKGDSTDAVRKRSDLRTPDGLYGMWGNVSELVLSSSSGYGGKVAAEHIPFITAWQGPSYEFEETKPRQDYWGYTHSMRSRSDQWGFRIVFLPKE